MRIMTAAPEIRRALVVEDDVDIRGLLVQILQREGFEVAEAATAPMERDLAVLLERYRRDHPDATAITGSDAQIEIQYPQPMRNPGKSPYAMRV